MTVIEDESSPSCPANQAEIEASYLAEVAKAAAKKGNQQKSKVKEIDILNHIYLRISFLAP